MLARLPIGLSSWAQIRREQLFFCDKTEQLSQLVQHFPRAFLRKFNCAFVGLGGS